MHIYYRYYRRLMQFQRRRIEYCRLNKVKNAAVSIASLLLFFARSYSFYKFRFLLSIAMNAGKYSGVQPLETILPL